MSHEYYIKRCIELAKQGYGYVSPNPLVGSVIVQNGEIISEGWHRKYGDIHAEVHALQNCKNTLSDETILYCSLEPCSHSSSKKINRPCALQIIESGIKHVVIGIQDPNPEVSGNGVNLLRKAGIRVDVGFCEDECNELITLFKTHITKQRAHITLKIAQTLDGKIATSTGSSKWITSETVRKEVHLYRAMYDAVLVGADTVIADNPKLNVRHVEGRNPYRVIVDSHLRIPLSSTLFTDELANKTIVCTTSLADPNILKRLHEMEIEVLVCNVTGNHINLKDMLYRLYERRIYSVFVEGGMGLTTAFISKGYYDDILFMIAPKLIGDGKFLVGDLGIKQVTDAIEFKHVNYRILDNHMIVKGAQTTCSLDL